MMTAAAAAKTGASQPSHAGRPCEACGRYNAASACGAGTAAVIFASVPTIAWHRAHPATWLCARASSGAVRPPSTQAASVSASRQDSVMSTRRVLMLRTIRGGFLARGQLGGGVEHLPEIERPSILSGAFDAALYFGGRQAERAAQLPSAACWTCAARATACGGRW